jgi:hypothetical protein
LEQEQYDVLHGLDADLLELPRMAEGIDLGSLYTLADRLRHQGVRGFDAAGAR